MSKRPRSPSLPLPLPLPPPSRSTSPPPESEAQDSSVYIIYRDGGYSDFYTYSIYKIDLDAEGEGVDEIGVNPMPPPLFRLDMDRFPLFMGFLAMDRKIWMFGGAYLKDDKLSCDVFVYDTSIQHSEDEFEDPFKLFTKPEPMIAAKFNPIVFSIGTKIYVLPRSFDPTLTCLSSPPLFEEYDVKTDSWSPLPTPPMLPTNANVFIDPDRVSDDDYTIIAYAVTGVTVVLSMHIGIYMFNVSTQAEGWTKVITIEGVDRLPFDQMAHYLPLDGMWYGLERNCLRAYDLNKEDGLKNARDVLHLGTEFSMSYPKRSNSVLCTGTRTLAIVTSALHPHPPRYFAGLCPPRHHLILRLLHFSNSKSLSYHMLQFSIADDITSNTAEVQACLLMYVLFKHSKYFYIYLSCSNLS